MRMIGPANHGVSFADVDGTNADELALNTSGQKGQQTHNGDSNRRTPSYNTCYNCGKKGHYVDPLS
jgi:hypothetical protein